MGRVVRCVGGWVSELYELHHRNDVHDDGRGGVHDGDGNDDGSGDDGQHDDVHDAVDGLGKDGHTHTQTRHENNNKKERKRNEWAVVFVPGNPGVLGFYYEFLTAIYEHFNATVRGFALCSSVCVFFSLYVPLFFVF